MSTSAPVSPVSTISQELPRPPSPRPISPSSPTPSAPRVSQGPQSSSALPNILPIQQPAGNANVTVNSPAPVVVPPAPTTGPKLATWGINWVQPTWMIIFLLCGILLAVGHHLYYGKLNGSTAGSASRQQWPIRFGTAFAYLTTSCLNAAIGLAFTQQLWRSLRQKPFSVDSLDKLFAMTTDPTSFWSWNVLSRAKIVSFLALVVWIVPFAGIVPPATLTVNTDPSPHVSNMAFGVPDWNTLDLITRGIGDVATVPSDVMLKIAWQTAERSQILPIEAPAVNSSFDLTFFGPTIRCAAPTDAQQEAFSYYVSRIRNESRIYVASDLTDVPINDPPSAQEADLFYSAFSPRLSELANDPIVDAFYNNWRPELGTFSPSNPLRPGVLQDAILQELWIQLANESIVCQMANASFDVHIENLNGAQSVTLNGADALPEYNQTYLENSDSDCSDWDNEAYCATIKLDTPRMNYIGWYGAFARLLNGNITLVANGDEGNNFTVTTNMLQQSGLSSCPELAKNFWYNYCQTTIGASRDFCGEGFAGDTTEDFPEPEPYFCRNGSLARAIEDLANNITISLLSNQQLPWGSTLDDINEKSLANKGVTIPVTVTTFINVYTYDWSNLVISYGVAVLFALVAVLLGGVAFRQNGVGYVSSFSAIVATTRNRDLDVLTEGQCLGAVPLAVDFGRSRLRFGLVGSETEKVRHATFGLENTVHTLQNGAVCS